MNRSKFISRSKNIYNEFKPSNELKDHIDKIFEFTCSPHKGRTAGFKLSPHYTSSILFVKFSGSKRSRLLISGPNKKANALKTKENVQVICFAFKPMILPLIFNVKPSVLIDKFTALSKAAGKREAAELLMQLEKAFSADEIITHLNDFILKKLPPSVNIEPEIMKVTQAIILCEGNLRLKDIYSSISMSKRSFQRKFLEYSGFTPKEFCEILRFGATVRKLVVKNYKHYDVLVESGYYDQSHYNKQFKKFVGLAPLAYEVRQKTISFRNIII
jgi:AraC-like DNA-binding protein